MFLPSFQSRSIAHDVLGAGGMKERGFGFMVPDQGGRPNGLVVGYLLWVQGIPGSNPGWAPLFAASTDQSRLRPLVDCDREADVGA